LSAADVARFLTALRADEARSIRMVEIFLPVETLRRVEIVDTPGLNSILPEHERVTRDFLQEADAIVWVFAIGQAAKATERRRSSWLTARASACWACSTRSTARTRPRSTR
jgi:hypothetical protein